MAFLKTFFVQRVLGYLVITDIPNFFMLDNVIRLHRVRTLITITDRGYYKAITGDGIKIVAKEGTLTKNVNGVKIPNGTFWQGSFRKEFPKTINREQYELNKVKSIKGLLQNLNEDLTETKMIQVAKVAKEVGLSPRTIKDKIKKGLIEGKQIGQKYCITKKAYDKLMSV
jgi:hypothetical protein